MLKTPLARKVKLAVLIIADYLILLLRLATYFYGLLLLVVLALFVIKRRGTYLFMLGESLAESLEEISTSYIKIVKIFIVLLVLRILIKIIVETESYVYIRYWLNKALYDHDVILGVFIASLLSIIVHGFLNNAHKRNEIRKNSAMLYNDLKSIIDSLTKAKLHIEAVSKEKGIDQKKFLFHALDPIMEIRHNTKWRDHYTSIHEHLPYKYYKKIDTLYSVVEEFNKAVRQEDIGLLKRCITRAFPGQVGGYVYLQKITPTQLLKSLERLTKNRKVKTEVYKFLFNELRYAVTKCFTYKIIENEMVGIIEKHGKTTYDKIEPEIKNWLAAPDQKFLKHLCWSFLPRLLFDIGSKSKYINHVWDEYTLAKKS